MSIKQSLLERQTLIALLLIEENNPIANKVDKSHSETISNMLLLDLIVSLAHNQRSSEAMKRLHQGIDLLAQ